MIDKNLKSVRKIDLDSVSINLLRNTGKEAYDQVLVKKKKKLCCSIFLKYVCWLLEFSNLIKALNLTGAEYDLLIDELMFSTLHTENKIIDNIIDINFTLHKTSGWIYPFIFSRKILRNLFVIFNKVRSEYTFLYEVAFSTNFISTQYHLPFFKRDQFNAFG